jgi:hypothetical protein
VESWALFEGKPNFATGTADDHKEPALSSRGTVSGTISSVALAGRWPRDGMRAQYFAQLRHNFLFIGMDPLGTNEMLYAALQSSH